MKNKEFAEIVCQMCGRPMNLTATRNTFACTNRANKCSNYGRPVRVPKLVQIERD